EVLIDSRINFFKSIKVLAERFRKMYASELFVCVFELLQLGKYPTITMENITESEKKIIKENFLDAMLNLENAEAKHVHYKNLREAITGLTYFRLELYPALLQLLDKKIQKRQRSKISFILSRFDTRLKEDLCKKIRSGYAPDMKKSSGFDEWRFRHLENSTSGIYDRRLFDDWEDPEWDDFTRPDNLYPYSPHATEEIWWKPEFVRLWMDRKMVDVTKEYALRD
ncbi:hypothetical protein PFISCL1PPCAC_11196, partial [Pristionchus fissidentatus]